MNEFDGRLPGEEKLFRPVETKRASEAIFEQVRELIAAGKLKPGDRLPSERKMIEMFQRSRPTIREALRMLERAGYIRTVPGSSGTVILPPNDKNLENSLTDALSVGQISLEELAEFRAASEAAAAGWAAKRRTEEDLAAMEALLERMADSLEDYERSAELDQAFHGLVAKAAGNAVSVIFNGAVGRLNMTFAARRREQMTPEEQLEMSRRVYAMHRAIFEAVRDGDAKTARAAMERHLTAFRDDLET